MLGSSNVTVTNANYKLAIQTTADGAAVEDGDVPTEAKSATVWRINGTTAIYKTVNTAYYTLNEDTNTVVYHPEVDNEILAGFDIMKIW